MISTCHETFQFGAGKPKISTRQMTFPAAVGEECFLLGTNIVKASTPFLGSLTTLQKLGCVLDFPNQKAHLTHLNRTAKLRLLEGPGCQHCGVSPRAQQESCLART